MYYYKYNFFCNKLNLKKIIDNFFPLECCNNILLLKNPKIITLAKNKNTASFVVNVDDLLKTEEYVKNTPSFKFDKKYKSSVSANDKQIIKSKKGKNKLVKDKHKNDDAKNFVRNEENIFVSDSVVRTNLKSRKIGLKNRKAKVKLENSSLSSINSFVDNEKDKEIIRPKSIFLDSPISVEDLSLKINVHEAEIITYLFLNKSVSATINQILDFDIASEVIEHYGFSISKISPNVESTSIINASSDKKEFNYTSNRPPIITILGHVDHGKTTLLESILKVNLVNKEQGGITQSIHSYEVVHEYNSKTFNLIFLDTPGHQSFKSIRFRGARVTDIILLVIAVDDGVKPQTIESIEYIKDMSLNCIVVLTKADKMIDNIQKIKEDLANYSLLSDEWGGDTQFISVSAINGNNINDLLSKICILSSSMNLVADNKEDASGVIIDSFIDKKQGLLTTIVIKNGTLNIGDLIASENSFGKVKRIINSVGKNIRSALPSSIVEVLCFSSTPDAGSNFYTFTTEKEVKKYCADYVPLKKDSFSLMSLNKRVSSDLETTKKKLPLLIKADTQGSLEAIIDLLSNISQGKVQINTINASLGNITNNDVELAYSTSSSILGFNVSALPQISLSIKKYRLNFKVFHVIYDLFDHVQNLMLDLLEPEYNYVLIGNLNIQSVFNMNKGFIAGCIVTSGKVKINSFIKVYRNDLIIHEGYVTSLKQIKNDVEEVLAPDECGLMSDFHEWQKSDLIEIYDTTIKDKKL